jgi:hypothetical protein
MYCRNRYYLLSCEGASPKMLARRDQRRQRGPPDVRRAGVAERFYIMIANALALITSDLEAAAILGTRRLAVARTVTLPMVAPALVNGFILAVLQALALFGSPAILAMPAGFHTITTQIWSFFHFPPAEDRDGVNAQNPVSFMPKGLFGFFDSAQYEYPVLAGGMAVTSARRGRCARAWWRWRRPGRATVTPNWILTWK